MIRRLVIACALAAATLACVSDGRAQVTSDLAAEFSSVINSETSIWSFRYRPDTDRNGNYLLLPTFGPAVGNWSPSNPGAWTLPGPNLPEMGVNRTGVTASNTTASPQDAFSVLNGSFWMRPALGQIAVVTWLFPFNEPRSILFEENDRGLGTSGGGATIYHENRRSDGTLFGGSGSHGVGSGSSGSSLFGGLMGPGDRVNFILDPRTTANFDSMSINIVVSVVPEPSALILGLLGIGSTVLLFKRRSK